MKKTFWFLMLVVVILPTFGFTTADAFVKLILDGGQDYRCHKRVSRRLTLRRCATKKNNSPSPSPSFRRSMKR